MKEIKLDQVPPLVSITIPCYNGARFLQGTLNSLVTQSFKNIEIILIDDGSTDRTVEVAKNSGVNHIIKNTNNLGLARSFQAGLDACLALGADIIANTDGEQHAEFCRPTIVQHDSHVCHV